MMVTPRTGIETHDMSRTSKNRHGDESESEHVSEQDGAHHEGQRNTCGDRYKPCGY